MGACPIESSRLALFSVCRLGGGKGFLDPRVLLWERSKRGLCDRAGACAAAAERVDGRNNGGRFVESRGRWHAFGAGLFRWLLAAEFGRFILLHVVDFG